MPATPTANDPTTSPARRARRPHGSGPAPSEAPTPSTPSAILGVLREADRKTYRLAAEFQAAGDLVYDRILAIAPIARAMRADLEAALAELPAPDREALERKHGRGLRSLLDPPAPRPAPSQSVSIPSPLPTTADRLARFAEDLADLYGVARDFDLVEALRDVGDSKEWAALGAVLAELRPAGEGGSHDPAARPAATLARFTATVSAARVGVAHILGTLDLLLDIAGDRAEDLDAVLAAVDSSPTRAA